MGLFWPKKKNTLNIFNNFFPTIFNPQTVYYMCYSQKSEIGIFVSYTIKQLFKLFQLLEINNIVLSNHLAVYLYFVVVEGPLDARSLFLQKTTFCARR